MRPLSPKNFQVSGLEIGGHYSVTIEQLEAQAHALTDNQAAKNLQKQKTILFNTLTERLTSLAA